MPGYAAGVFGRYYIIPRVGININVLYVQGGSKLVNSFYTKDPTTGQPLGFRNELTLRIHSIRTPVFLSWDMTKKVVRPFVKMGAAPNWLLGGTRNVYDHVFSTGEVHYETESLRLNSRSNRSIRYDWSFYTGVGFSVQQRFLMGVDLFLGPQRGYYFAEGTCPVNAYCVNFDESYHNRAILVTLSYGF